MKEKLKIIEENIRFCGSIINDNLSKLEYIESELKNKENLLSELISNQAKYDKIILLFQKVGEFARTEIKTQIETIVSKCLSMIFQDEVNFHIVLTEKRDSYSAEIFVENDYEGMKVLLDPKDAKGGGIVDIISLALRIAFIQLHTPIIQGPVLLDEPGKHLSSEYTPYLSEFLSNVSHSFNRQILMVTHDKHLSSHADRVYYVSLKQGITEVKEIKIQDI